jgi:hypothetical protein
VPKELIEHSLNVDPKAISKKQRLRRFAQDKRETIKKELVKLLVAGFVQEVYHLEWLANPILVSKKNNYEWRMCVIILISISIARMIPFGSHASTKSLTLQVAVCCSPSFIATRATIRLPSRKKTRSRQRSSSGLVRTPTQLCPSS